MSLATGRLNSLGFDHTLESGLQEGEVLGRVLEHSHDLYVVATGVADVRARAPARLKHHGLDIDELPEVGDWVVLDEGSAITRVLPRRSYIARKVAGKSFATQVLAANVDVALIVASMESGPNVRSLERYITAAWDGGVEPAIVLNKSDLATDFDGAVAGAEAVALGSPVIPTSALVGTGVDEVRALLAPDRTGVVLGPSGVGKSSLINRLCGGERQAVAEVREDGKGRHTTSARSLIRLPGGGVLIDTPGMREIGLIGDGGGLDEAFADVVALADSCRFRDCSHATEPGCAITAAIDSGELAASRFDDYKKLQREIAFANRKSNQRAMRAEKMKWKQITKQMRDDPRVHKR